MPLTYCQSKSMKELCGTMSSPQVWDDPLAASEFGRRVLHPQLVKELYALSSEVLMAKAAKQIMLVRYPDLEVDDDPFTIQPEDDLVLMESQQPFDDTVTLES
ncbi:hypothetical protein BHE74_00030606 [Ensete ventricosum]|nr:hypothetical protein BHE74_00030606 [Ensete ventricosum]